VAAPGERVEVLLPDLGMADAPLRASVWLVDAGDEVSEGDRILEVLSPNVTVDVPAPLGGVLLEQRVAEGELLRPGQVLAVIQAG
jgi:pyruvate/2-oxoglutarate dehydrogenase complex dihydrolipoamide acyltransferase (E2) component